MHTMKGFIFSCLILLSPFCFAEQKEIAMTIDDLPFVGTTHNKPGNLMREQQRFFNLMNPMIAAKIPAVGFVISGTIEKDQWQLLEQFKDEGFVIANHTQTHANLNTTDADRYIKDIANADDTLTPLMNSPKFFRYPYLAEGSGEKKQRVRNFLKERNYVIAPVTVDSKDFKFNAQILNIYWRNRPQHLPSIKKRYLAYMWNQTLRAERLAEAKYGKPMPQILLIHANYLNSHSMKDIIDMYQSNGYTFISLEKALQAYEDGVQQKVERAEETEQASPGNT